MPPVIRIPNSLYSRLEKHAKGFDTPINVIERLADHYDHCDAAAPSSLDGVGPSPDNTPVSTRSRGNTVEDWQKCVEVVLDFKQGSTPLDDNAPFIKNIYDKFCRGEPAYGVSGVNAMEAYLRVIKKYNPDKFDLALIGLRKSIEQSDKPFHKMRALLERASGVSF
jgi:hypothetical protein